MGANSLWSLPHLDGVAVVDVCGLTPEHHLLAVGHQATVVLHAHLNKRTPPALKTALEDSKPEENAPNRVRRATILLPKARNQRSSGALSGSASGVGSGSGAEASCELRKAAMPASRSSKTPSFGHVEAFFFSSKKK